MAKVEILNEVTDGEIDNWCLCFQECIYHYDDGTSEDGFRFIWRRPDGSLQAARGQARIPDPETLFRLTNLAAQAGWFTI
ncbi:MAG: hypothetical protein Q8928_06420 [Bacteroidota bacterium]|nr:hypothetical protein [Bacteroidota bacterium]